METWENTVGKIQEKKVKTYIEAQKYLEDIRLCAIS